MRHRPLHHTVVRLDVADSGSRDDQLQLRMRQDLLAIVGSALAAQAMDRTALDIDDWGDGLRLEIPATVTPAALLDPFVPNLVAGLCEHRKSVAEAARLRLRMAVHTGLLHRDDAGWAGEPLVHCARLLDAAPVRRALRAAVRADVVLVVSQA